MKKEYTNEEKIKFFESKLNELNIEVAYRSMIYQRRKLFLTKKIEELNAKKTGTKES